MPLAGFESMIAVFEVSKTIHLLTKLNKVKLSLCLTKYPVIHCLITHHAMETF